MNEYDRALSNGRHPVLIGYPELKKETVFGLEPGTFIKKIGADGIRGGKQSSSSRKMDFDDPVMYEGSIIIDDTYYISFLHNDKFEGRPVHLLWVALLEFDELILQDIPGQSIFIHKAKFEKAYRRV